MGLINRYFERRKVRRRLLAIRKIVDLQECGLCGRTIYGHGVKAFAFGPDGIRNIELCAACLNDPTESLFTAAAERQFVSKRLEEVARPSSSLHLGNGPTTCPAGGLPPAGTF